MDFSAKQKKSLGYVIDVDMGYGHARAAHALRDLASHGIITANVYPGIPPSERALWKRWQEGYETLSRLQPIPIIGPLSFQIMEKFQEIAEFYPKRDLSKPNLALNQAMRLIRRYGLGKHLVSSINEDPLPAICTHPIPAFALEEHGYKGDIWCVPTDADVARPWVSVRSQQSRIRYCCANGRLMERLQQYGVSADRLFLTGFPLPKDLIGGKAETILRRDLKTRICHLDPQSIFRRAHQPFAAEGFSGTSCRLAPTRPLTVTFAVGGAGAQRSIGVEIIKSCKRLLRQNVLRLRLIAGMRADVAELYANTAKEAGARVEIVYREKRSDYLQAFNDAMHDTDVLWTKPSELAFYAALGIPIIMAPPLGRQEEFNAMWLTQLGAGVRQEDPRYAGEWLMDWVESGGLARMAWNGYTQAPRHGAYRIEDVILGRPSSFTPPPMIV